MSRPTQFEAAELLKLLTDTPVKPSVLAQALNASRATVHRKLDQLLTEGLAVRVGSGPQAAYCRPASHLHSTAGDSRVRFRMDRATAEAVVSGLDLFSRLGTGRLEKLADIPENLAASEQLVPVLLALKRELTGIPANASHGIHSRRVHPVAQQAWAMASALRHRMAWDLSPGGAKGTWAAAPNLEAVPGLVVGSDLLDAQGLPTRYDVELSGAEVAVIGMALDAVLQVTTGNYLQLVQLAEAGFLPKREDAPLAMSVLTELCLQLARLQAGPTDSGVPLSEGQRRQLRVARACSRFGADPSQKVHIEEATEYAWLEALDAGRLAGSVDALPPGMLLHFSCGQHQVLAPVEPDLYRVVAKGPSVGEAVAQALLSRAAG